MFKWNKKITLRLLNKRGACHPWREFFVKVFPKKEANLNLTNLKKLYNSFDYAYKDDNFKIGMRYLLKYLGIDESLRDKWNDKLRHTPESFKYFYNEHLRKK